MQAYALSHVFPHRGFLEITKACIIIRNIIPIFSHRVFKGIKRNMLISIWTQSKGECYKTLFDLINTTVTIEDMNLVVKAIVTAIVKAVY